MKLIATLALLFAVLGAASAQCGNRPDDWSDHFCKLEAVQDEGILVGAIGVCDATNTDSPFLELSDACQNLLKEDGNDCVYAAARFECSYDCQTCALDLFFKPCYSVCTTLQSECPKAMEANCFPNLLTQKCTSENNNDCTSIDISESKVRDLMGNNGGGDSDSASELNRSMALVTMAICAVASVVLAF